MTSFSFSRDERVTLAVFGLIALLWMTGAWHGISYTVVALAGICLLLLTNVLAWDEVVGDRVAWDTFIWYGGLVRMAGALGESGVTRVFAESYRCVLDGFHQRNYAVILAVRCNQLHTDR